MGLSLKKPRRVELNYVPRPLFLPFHNRKQRWAVLVCHRRCGKTVCCVNELVLRAIYTKKKNARYSYICPTFSQAKDVAWTYLKDAVQDFAVQIRESELRVVLPNGAWVTLYGADNQDRLRGVYHDGLICDEYGDCRPSLWGEILLPATLDRDGWAVFIGTPKGKNHFYKQYLRSTTSDDWFSMKMGANESNILTPEQLRIAKAEYVGRESEYEQEMLCSFTAAVKGTYFSEVISTIEDQGHMVQESLYNPAQPVHAVCDLGFSDSTAFWFWQSRPDGIAIIDFEEGQGKKLDYYFEMLREKGYEYDTVWLPHDAKAKTLQTGRSTIEQFIENDFPCHIVPKLDVQHGIDAARAILPVCWFNQKECCDGIEHLRSYRRKYDEINQVYLDKPLHNAASNAADSFRYLSLVASVDGSKIGSAKSRIHRNDIPKGLSLTLDNLFATREAKTYGFKRHRI